ncbi:MAG: DUF4350 domain-containing protein [Caldilinea sp. CFX5]|nr:DUF4350 domain-containing protein [Caldilinea sp. CFX5]
MAPIIQTGRATGRIQLFLALGLLVVLVAFILVQGEEQAPTPFDPSSTAPTGLRALWLWLETMGYTVERNDGATFAIPPESALLFVYPNQQVYSDDEAEQVRRWVNDGGTLVLVGLTLPEEALRTRFPVETGAPVNALFADVDQQQPLFPDLAEPIALTENVPTLDLSNAPTVISILATSDGQTTLALQPLGDGVIWHLSLYHSLTNEQLRDPSQATIVPALLRHVPAGGRIVFDTYHLFGPNLTADLAIRSLQDWVYGTALGWATLFMAVVTLLFLALQGVRLGPPLPTREELRRREAAEFVTAMANLLRRGQQRAFVATHHKRRLKRALGRALNISPDLADDAFLRQVQQVDDRLSTEEKQQLTAIFQTLTGAADESTLIKTISQVDPLLARYQRKGT